jgi:anti-sigma-K factor RskA
MDLQSFIQSGLLESYVLGQCTRGERALVEQMLAQHPEARAEMSAIEQALEGYASSQAIAPPQGLKGQIMEAIEREARPLSKPRSGGTLLLFQLLALGLLAAAVFFFFQKNKEADEKTALSKQIADIEVRLNGCDQSNQDLRDIINVLRSPETRPVKIGSGGGDEEKLNTYVFSNKSRCKVLLDMSGMPAAGSGEYFQMWALVGGVPVSMGMIDIKSTGGLQEFACIPNAEAYAVSMEDKPEGNPAPTVVRMSGALVEEGE